MSDLLVWQARNNDYLAAGLAWLRLRLWRFSQRDDRSTASAARVGEGPGCAGERVSAVAGDDEEARAVASMDSAEAMVPPPALAVLSECFGLSRFERNILWLCVALELDPAVATLCARAQDDSARPYPTFALALTLFEDPAWEALSPERPLRYWRLIEVNQAGAQPLTTSALRADERIVNYVKGLNHLDDRLWSLVRPLEAGDGDGPLAESQEVRVNRVLRIVRRRAASGELPVVQLEGTDALSKRALAGRVARALGLRLYLLHADLLPAQHLDLETLTRLWQRESTLLPIALYIDALDAERSPEGSASPLARLLSGRLGLTFLDTREWRSRIGRPSMVEDIAKPTPDEQEVAWRTALGELAADNPSRLAGQFSVNLAAIQQISEAVLDDRPLGAEPEQPLHERLWQACLVHTRPRLESLAQRLEPKATWDDLVVPEGELGLLRQVAAQVHTRRRVYDEWGFRDRMNRGLGVSALFAGESGTGKTMAGEVLANHLRLNLYRIDLSAVVSKYIGETEKNLRRLFDAAEDGGAILFFDEADALFGKRSEVKDSHDRYANIEINYLLQRMEAYQGLAILATNMKAALDHAFLRRLRFIINFPFPGPAERKRIWRKAFPRRTPVGALDYERLARLSLAGGSIHNIALNAAFLAAQDGGVVEMASVLSAARSEFIKLDRPISEADFVCVPAGEVSV